MVFMIGSLETIWKEGTKSELWAARMRGVRCCAVQLDMYLGEFLLRRSLLLEAVLQSHVDFLLQLVHLRNICQPESV